MLFTLVPHEGIDPSLRRELGFEPSASTSSANGALILDGSERNKENFEKQPRTIGTVSLDLTESVSEKGAKQYPSSRVGLVSTQHPTVLETVTLPFKLPGA